MGVRAVSRGASANPAAEVLDMLQHPDKYLEKIATLERWTAEHDAAAAKARDTLEELQQAERTAEARHAARVAELTELQDRPGEMLAKSRAEMLEAIDMKLECKRVGVELAEWTLDEPDDHPGRDERVAKAAADMERLTADIAALEEKRKAYA